MSRFARLESEQLDQEGKLHLKVVENERVVDSSAEFHDRVRRILMEHIIGILFNKNVEDLRVRGADTNVDEMCKIMKSTIGEVINELIEANPNDNVIGKLQAIDQEALLKKMTVGGPKRVICPMGPWDDKYQLSLRNIIPTR